jgi:hypothetical protein
MNSKNQSSDPNKGENMATTPSTTDFGLDKITDPAIKTKQGRHSKREVAQ